MMREKSSPSALEHNVTAAVHAGQRRRSDPEVSYDGKKIVFAMRCPTTNTSTIGGVAGVHRSLEHLGIRHDRRGADRAAPSVASPARPTDDDVDPAYLPAGRGFVFASNRQTKSKSTRRSAQLLRARRIRARARVQPAHDGRRRRRHHADLVQPEPRPQPGGAARTATSCSRAGSTSARATASRSSASSPTAPTCSCSTARTARATASCIRATWTRRASTRASSRPSLMPLSGTQEGGALMLIDAANFSEQNTPANAQAVAGTGGQAQSTAQELNLGRGLSQFGRITTPYPAVGRHRPRAARLPPVRGDAQRRGRPVRRR